MQEENRLVLPFKGLKEGLHDFRFVLTDKFFSALDYSEIQKGSVSVNVSMNKMPQHLELEVNMEGVVSVMCDRCLDYFDMQVEYSNTLYVKFNEELQDTDEDLIILSPEDHEVDITHYVYESVCLSLPYQRIHPNDKKGKSTCNKDMLKKLKQYSISSHESEETDPRWEKLKKLK